jgi:hypothetical protein
VEACQQAVFPTPSYWTVTTSPDMQCDTLFAGLLLFPLHERPVSVWTRLLAKSTPRSAARGSSKERLYPKLQSQPPMPAPNRLQARAADIETNIAPVALRGLASCWLRRLLLANRSVRLQHIIRPSSVKGSHSIDFHFLYFAGPTNWPGTTMRSAFTLVSHCI